jgi:hypothetical protein
MTTPPTKAAKSARQLVLTLLGVLGLLASGAYVYAAVIKPDYALGATPSSQTVARGSTAAYTVTLQPTGGFSDPVTLSVNGVPSGAIASFSTNPLSASQQTSTLSVATSSTMATGTYSLAIKGVGAGKTKTTTVSLTVTAPAPGTFTLAASPSSQTATAGTVTSYGVAISRASLSGPVTLSVASGLPDGATASFAPNPATASSSTLTVTTSDATTPDGTYDIVIDGTSAGVSATTTATLVVSTPKGSFTISGGVDGMLAPGVSQPIYLAITNPYNFDISVTNVTVAVQSVSAPNADAAHPCTPSDYSVTQFSGAYPMKVKSSRTSTLSGLGLPQSQLPRVGMINRPINQDGCKGADISLKYSGMVKRA